MAQKLTKARKEHKCTYCGDIISVNELYVSVKIPPWHTNKNTTFVNWKIHPECKEFGDKYYWDDEECCINPLDGDYVNFKEYMTDMNINNK